MSLATFKSATGHVRAITAVCPDNTAASVYNMITARFCCRLIAFFLFIFFRHVFTPLIIEHLYFAVFQWDAYKSLVVDQFAEFIYHV